MRNSQQQAKTWWGPVWRGLVVDADGKHYQSMKGAVWLFLYLVIHADRPTGISRRKYRTISTDMGVSYRTIRRWMRVLAESSHIEVQRTDHTRVIHILKWRSVLSLAAKRAKLARFKAQFGQGAGQSPSQQNGLNAEKRS